MTMENRVVVITGATGALGTVVTRALASLGAKLALLDRDSGRLDDLTKNLSAPDEDILALSVDLLDPTATTSAAKSIAARFGHIDILIHLVGGWVGGKTILEAAQNDLEFMLNQHVWTSFHVTRAFLPDLVKNGWGRIIMITSPFASRPQANGGTYAIGKAGQEALMLTLSEELKNTGVTANLLLAKAIDAKGAKVADPSPKNASWTTPDELSAAIRFLLSEEAGTINGAKIPLYGSY
ncbi:MAG: SDR family oxidoreductase [Chloroflexota bacterium]